MEGIYSPAEGHVEAGKGHIIQTRYGVVAVVKASWESRKFHKRECVKFREEKFVNGESQCSCGLARSKHHNVDDLSVIKDPDVKWTPKECTTKLPTDTYGEVEFAEDTSSKKPYIRVSEDTEGIAILKLMTKKWNLKVPNLIISVTGGAKSFHMPAKLKEAFSKGLVKVAVSTGAWIITGGTNTGVMKHVGEAVKDRAHVGRYKDKISVIGIATWGIVDGTDALISPDGQGLYPAYYSMQNYGSGRAPLDVNHSHFILVDNGTAGQYGVEIPLRSRIEGAAMEQMKTLSNTSAGAVGIPVVILCLEGGPGTVNTMASGIKMGVPCVIIDGSGRAADVVAYAYSKLVLDEENNFHVIDPTYVNEVKQRVSKVFGEKNKEKIYHDIAELLKIKNMVTVYRLDDEEASQDMDLIILTALLKAQKSSVASQLQLALAWNRIDVAKSEIFSDKAQTALEASVLGKAMVTALVDDKPDFVKLFFNEGLSLRQFLTVEVLISLYEQLPETTPIKQVINKTLREPPETSQIKQLINKTLQELKHRRGSLQTLNMQIIGGIIENLMGDKYRSRYKDKRNTEYFMNVRSDVKFSIVRMQIGNIGPDIKQPIRTPWRDLFIWAVLANRREMALLFLERGRENLAMALMATKLLKSLVAMALSSKDMMDIGADMLGHADEFEAMAVGILEECRKEDDIDAQRLVIKELPEFGHLTNLDIAISAEDQNFIAHPTCQALLSRIWMGAMELDTPIYKTGMCFFIFPLIPFIIRFYGDEDQNDANKYENKELKPLDSNVIGQDEENDGYELHEYTPKETSFLSKFTDLEYRDEVIEVTMRKNAPLSNTEKIIRFYQAPSVKFFSNVISYVAFLSVFSYIILSHFKFTPHVLEYILQAWVVSVIFDEFRQVLAQEPKKFMGKIKLYFKDAWNIADIISLLSFAVATGFRYSAWKTRNNDFLATALIIYATDMFFFIIRLLQIFSIDPNLGPKLVMIRKMMIDLAYFLFILVVVIIGYGVALQAIRFPNTTPWNALKGVVNKPYWQLYGELFIEDLFDDPKNCATGKITCNVPGEDVCSTPYSKTVAPILLAMYMMFTNILLLNLLIAIFNYTFQKVQDDSDKVWKFQRFDLIEEYHSRPALAPPLILISHIRNVFLWILEKCNCCHFRSSQGSQMKLRLSPDEKEALSRWEFTATEVFLYQRKQLEAEKLDEIVKDIQERVSYVTYELQDVGDGKTDKGSDCSNTGRLKRMASMQSSGLDERMDTLELQIQQLRKLLVQQNGKQGDTQESQIEQLRNLLVEQNEKQAMIMEAIKSVRVSILPPRDVLLPLHMKARVSPYSRSDVNRTYVPDEKVYWQIPFPDYSPVEYTSNLVLAGPVWADPNIKQTIQKLPFNHYDAKERIDRRSYHGSYDVIDGLPRNPVGRTGITGRGLLGKWGPNHAADSIITRWKDKQKRILEFVSIKRKDCNQCAIPGGMVDFGEVVEDTLKREFMEEALRSLEISKDKAKMLEEKMNTLLVKKKEIYKGYVDDPRNTDNAWMETFACNFHDETGEIFGEDDLQAGDDSEDVKWQPVSSDTVLYASHLEILRKVAQLHKASF